MKKIKLFLIVLIIQTLALALAGYFFFFGFGNGIGKISINDDLVKEFILNDSLKQVSVNFLLENAEDKYSSGYTKRIRRKDKYILSEQFLFRNIEQAIEQSTERLDSGIFTTDQFLNYVLPYRIRYEEPENWRKIALDSTKNCYDDDILIHLKNINNKVRKGFKYTNSRTNRKLSDLLTNKYGACNEMSEFAAFVMRANGIPVAIDFAKWSSTRGKHQWNSILTKNRNYPFMGLESVAKAEKGTKEFIGKYKKAAKYYRQTFEKYKDKYKDYNPKKVFNKVNFIDVTKEYCPDCKDIIIKFPNELIENDVFFLCIYEVDNWVPVDFAFAKDGILTFNEVCPNNIFMLKKRVENNLEYFKTPLTFDTSANVSFVEANPKNQEQLELTFDNSPLRELRKSNKELGMNKTGAIRDSVLQYNFTAIVNDSTLYRLFYWDEEWIKIEDKKPKNGLLQYTNAPRDALYKLEDLNNPKSIRNRCFTISENNQQLWW